MLLSKEILTPNQITIYHHLGLGDHIACNGLVRHFAESAPIKLICYKKNIRNVSYMYRDNPVIDFIGVDSDGEASGIVASHTNVKRLGFIFNPSYSNIMSYDRAFYAMANIDFNIRFNKFFLQRDQEAEDKVYKALNPDNDPYIYVHDDKTLNYVIDNTKHRNDIKIIYNDMNYGMFDMGKIIENATEIHTMQTGFLDLCHSMDIKCPIYIHLYVRNYPESYFSVCRNSNNYILVN